ncbi:MAG: response regulator [Mariprofundaceae bacterium]|nr:response regulator [Mariprofundaceae bacterium]
MTTILMVDDDDILLELYSEVLSEGFHVLIARTVAEAIELLTIEKVDAVGCDYHLGHELGLDVVAWIDSYRNHLLATTMLISGEPFPAMRGFHVRCLYKPVPMDELLNVFYTWFAPVTKGD